MAEGRFASVSSVEEFILEQENKNTGQKTERDVRLLERFLKTKNEDRKIEDIPAVELNEYISQFIISVCTKDGNPCKKSPAWASPGRPSPAVAGLGQPRPENCPGRLRLANFNFLWLFTGLGRPKAAQASHGLARLVW